MYDYLLGGKDNFAADRETVTVALEAWPAARTAARENRAFLGRAVRYLAEEAGITQFLDIGSGLPSVGNVHEVAQDILPSAHVVYVDKRPDRARARAGLLASKPEGKCATSMPTCVTRTTSSATGPPGRRLTSAADRAILCAVLQLHAG